MTKMIRILWTGSRSMIRNGTYSSREESPIAPGIREGGHQKSDHYWVEQPTFGEKEQNVRKFRGDNRHFLWMCRFAN